jgi:hypothetical protein
MTSKKALGSMPLADEKSVPVFFSDCIAARMPCTAATQDTSEKTECKFKNRFSCSSVKLTDNLCAVSFSLLGSERGC